MKKLKILAFAGSLRKGSYNKMLIHIAVAAAEEAGADIQLIDLADYPMPIYDQDIEDKEGIPPNGLKIKKMMIESHGFLIASPEYNSSISGVLKNTIDWASRPQPGEPSLVAFKGKSAALISASPGALGGLRGLVILRSLLSNIFVTVLPEQVTIPTAHEAFDAQGQLLDPKKKEQVVNVAKRLVAVAPYL
jgi:chromate reductase, NAD(P)H dehydrogenase (quinone)